MKKCLAFSTWSSIIRSDKMSQGRKSQKEILSLKLGRYHLVTCLKMGFVSKRECGAAWFFSLYVFLKKVHKREIFVVFIFSLYVFFEKVTSYFLFVE